MTTTAPATSTTTLASAELPVASTWKRLAAVSVDGAIILALALAADPNVISQFMKMAFQPETVISWKFLGTSLGGTLLLRMFFLRWKAATPGKLLCGLRVINVDGPDPTLSWQQVVSRPIAELIFGYIGLTYTIAFFHRQRRHLPDLASFTRVVQDEPRGPIKVRWFFGGFLVLINLFQMVGLPASIRGMRVTSEGLVMTNPAVPPGTVAPPSETTEAPAEAPAPEATPTPDASPEMIEN